LKNPLAEMLSQYRSRSCSLPGTVERDSDGRCLAEGYQAIGSKVTK